MIYKTLSLFFLGLSVLPGSALAVAELRPERVFTADVKKTKAYVKDGLIVGGDRAIDTVTVRDIRRAANPGFDRVVIDLEGLKNGEPVAIPRPPYYQIAVSPDEKRLTFTVWGKPRLGFDARKVHGTFKKSTVVKGVELYPQLDLDSWTFVLDLKGGSPVEAFELSNPVRIIVDIKTPSGK